MTRALACFTVAYGAVRVRVRLLPRIADVDAEFHAGRRRLRGQICHAFFTPGASGLKPVGTIVLPADGRLEELVPHEVTHAVMYRLGGVHCSDDERLATAVGRLSARILEHTRRILSTNRRS